MFETQRSYYLKRAEDERDLAARAAVPEARRAHATLAGYYVELAASEVEVTPRVRPWAEPH